MIPERETKTGERWDDDRLGAAFAERYGRPAPRDLTVATLERMGETRRLPRWWPGLDRPTAGRLAAVVAVATVVVVGLAILPRASSTPAATAAASAGPSAIQSPARSTPYASFEPSPAVEGFAAVVAGLPVRSVADAATLVRDPDLRDTELAVGGWYSASDLALPCPYQGTPTSAVEIRCGDVRATLVATPQPILAADGSSIAGRSDSGDRITVRFLRPVNPIRGDSGPRDAMVTTPRPMILIGHFHDERAVRCPDDARTTCEQTFVVDGIAGVAGDLQDPAVSSQPTTAGTRLTAIEAAKLAADRIGVFGQVLSVGLEQGNDAPWFTASANADCFCPGTWFVRGYRTLLDDGTDPRAPGTPIAGWLIVDDRTGAIAGPLATGVPGPPGSFAFAPAPAGFPTTVEGLPVRIVADVVNPDRPPDLSETPIAVAGWFTQLPIHPCPSGAVGCNRETVVLAGSDKRLVTYGPGGFSTVVPSDAPVLNPAILPGGANPPGGGDGTPIRAIFIVHSGDPRADRQGTGDPVGLGTFVLDQVAWLDGDTLGQGPFAWFEPGLSPTRTVERVLRETDGGALTAPGIWPISISVVTGRNLPTVGIGVSDPSEPNRANAVVWVVRLVGHRPGDPTGPSGFGWMVVDDASGTILELTWTSP